ncbi:MAG: EAL domain-containing protein [Candidatus Omnitrophica bacterium]|nr:EAL domain-containing protein [Candidatus Omnitrophota bacterium]
MPKNLLDKKFRERTKSYQFDMLYPVFQPIVDTRTGKVIGYESLVRRKGKLCRPGDLIQRSYEEGLIIALNLECIKSSLRILPKMDNDKLLFVNVEPVTLGHCFAKGQEAHFLLRQYAAYRRRIVFELTEGMKIRDFPRIKRGVYFLLKLGCKFALDDVVGIGTKLAKLMTLQPHFIKIGMELVQRVNHSPFQQGLLGQIVNIGYNHNAKIIAEGIERKKDLAFLKHLGVYYAQGFYFARPKKTLQKTARNC